MMDKLNMSKIKYYFLKETEKHLTTT